MNQHEAHGSEHPSFLAHHFATPRQQFEAGKLGMWLFLSTEILLFSGLFCAYAVYRANHPEIFVYAHHFLDSTLGAINTVVLICSSFTMAWAVRSAQLGQKKRLCVLLAFTILCGFGFMGIKFIEYRHKWHAGLLPGKHYNPQAHEGDHAPVSGHADEAEHQPTTTAARHPVESAAVEPEHQAATTPASTPASSTASEEHTLQVPPTIGPAGLAAPVTTTADVHAEESTDEKVKNVQIFFSIYFAMTGLHGLHVLAGMSVIGWVLWRSMRGEFGPLYYTPVDLAGLYWHLVDLIWIYLFPLLYLIH
ncbi:MAG: hypothetical protein HJJLKODD_01885 [Phycisphaerae bacterium]|nr:hypothetical protein [Phycisphaerae bacterium]